MAEVLILSGGPGPEHDFEAMTTALAAVLDDEYRITVVTDPDEAAGRLRAKLPPGVLVVNARRWQMLEDDYASSREQWAYRTPGSTRAAIDGFVRDGGGLVGMHTAAMCFDDWPQWQRILGGCWNPSHSSVTEPQPTRLWITELDHPVVADLDDGFALQDQVLGDLDLDDAALVLGWAKRSVDHEPEPMLWVNTYGAGRVVYNGFGHDVTSLESPAHRQLIRQAVNWVIADR